MRLQYPLLTTNSVVSQVNIISISQMLKQYDISFYFGIILIQTEMFTFHYKLFLVNQALKH